MQGHDLTFGRSNALAICTTLEEALYDVISSIAYKKGPWEIEVVVNAQTNNIMISCSRINSNQCCSLC